MVVRFLCGCQSSEILNRENLQTMDTVGFDGEGFLICTVHHERRYGWRSLPKREGSNLPDYWYAAWTPLQIEAWRLFDELPVIVQWDEDYTSSIADRRDNRVAEIIGKSILDATGRQQKRP